MDNKERRLGRRRSCCTGTRFIQRRSVDNIKNVLNDLKIEGFEAAHIEAARMLDGFFGYATVSVGYQITFCRAIDGQIPFDSSILTPGVWGLRTKRTISNPGRRKELCLWWIRRESVSFIGSIPLL